MNYIDPRDPSYFPDPDNPEPDIFERADEAHEKDTINKQESHDTDL